MTEAQVDTSGKSISELVLAVRQSIKEPTANEITDLGDHLTNAIVDDHRTDTKLKKVYAYWFIGILIAQLVAMDAIFVCVGNDLLSFKEPSHLNLFMAGTLSEVFGVVYVITRYLFSKKDSSSHLNGVLTKAKK